MGFPTFINSANTQPASGTAAVPVTMPASLVAGRLLLAACQGGALANLGATGWTTITGSPFVGATYKIYVFGKIATGSDSMSVTRSAFSGLNVITHQFGTWSGSLSDIAFAGIAGADPPSLTPAGGAKDFLWMPIVAANPATATTGAPTNYSQLISSANAGAGWVLSTAQRALNASSENPGTFTGGGTTNAAAATIAIAGTASSGPPPGAFLPFFGMGHHDELNDDLAARRATRRPSGLYVPRRDLTVARAA